MSESRKRRAHQLFDRVLDLPAAERAAILDRECAGEPGLRALVDALLEADASTHTLLDSETPPLEWLAADPEAEEPRPPVPASIGPYRILHEVGRGGMATIYLAEREVGEVRQRVAVKLVKRGIDTDEVIRRFARETRLLASLEHPDIARFYDAGASADGRPYLVMEYIEGQPITKRCDALRMSVGDRLNLFRTVCEAVQFAHHRLVVHRDIKPSNIMVTDAGGVKLLDFGIAKLLTDEPDEEVPLTRTGIRVLTPEYAAPEQIRGDPISTATDVYALGLVLFELLTGRRPGVARRRTNAGESTPEASSGSWPPNARETPAPSTAIRDATREGEAGPVAASRGTTPERLRRRLHGDLDRIVLKALEPEPGRRYQSALELRDDLERHLQGMPVRARPDTVGYRLQKFARRHRAGVLTTAMVGALVVGFGGFYTVRITQERDLAQAEAAKAQVTTQFLQRLLGDAYPSVALGDTFSMGDLLRRAVLRIDSLDAQPGIQAELLRTLGDVYREQGRFDDALPLLERAVAIHRTTDQLRSREAGQALDALGHLRYEREEYDAALAAHRASLAAFERLYAPDDSLVLFALNNIAAVAAALGDYDEALRLHQEVLDRHARLFADTSQLVHVTWNNMGQLHHRMGDFDAAVRELREALRLRRLALPPDHPSTALTMNNLAAALERLDRLDEAEALHREALATFRRVYGPDHFRVGLSAYNLARVLRRKGELGEAGELHRLTLAIDRKTYGDEHLEIGVDLRALALVQSEAGDCEGAAASLREADAIFAKNDLPLTHRRRLRARAELGACLTTLGRLDEAEAILLASLQAVHAAPADADSAGAGNVAARLVDLYRAWGRPGAADSLAINGR